MWKLYQLNAERVISGSKTINICKRPIKSCVNSKIANKHISFLINRSFNSDNNISVLELLYFTNILIPYYDIYSNRMCSISLTNIVLVVKAINEGVIGL